MPPPPVSHTSFKDRRPVHFWLLIRWQMGRSSRPSFGVWRNTQSNFFWSLAKFAAIVYDPHPPSAPGDRLTVFCGPWHSSWWPIPSKPFILHLLLHMQRRTSQPARGPSHFAVIYTPKSRENILPDMDYYTCDFSRIFLWLYITITVTTFPQSLRYSAVYLR
jgi:hypothetical protein